MPRVTRSQTRNAQNQENTPKKIKKPLKSTRPKRQRNPKANIPDDLFGPEAVPLNAHCRQLFTGYYLNESKAKCDQIYVDTKNQAFVVPETSFLNFQRLFLLNRQFKRAVSTYFRYLHYHFSITSRPFNRSEFSGSNQLYFKPLDINPQPPLDKHKSVVTFRNGALLHVFKENKFFELKKQGLFRPAATSLTFDGSDTTKIPIKFNLFSDLKSLRFHASEDLSGAFQRLLNESFVSLKELAFYHPKFVSKITAQTAFPPNLQVLCSSVTPSTILDFNVNLYKQILLIETSKLEIGLELLIRLSKFSNDPILLNPKIQELSIQWTHWPDDISTITSKLLVNVPFLKVIRFRERVLQELHAPRYGFGKRRKFTPKNNSFSCFANAYFTDIMLNLQNAVKNNDQPFPFQTIFEQGLLLFDGHQKEEDKISCMTYPIDVQMVFQPSKTTQIQLLENGRLVGSPFDFALNDPDKDVQTAMCELWTTFCQFNKLGQPDVNSVD